MPGDNTLWRIESGETLGPDEPITLRWENGSGLIFRKTIGLTSLLQDALSDLGDKIELAFVVGSMASGRQTAGSDLDICVLGEVSLREIVKALSPVQETLQREINPVVMTPKKFSEQSRKKDRFVTRVLSEPILFIKATRDELAELTEDRATGRA